MTSSGGRRFRRPEDETSPSTGRLRRPEDETSPSTGRLRRPEDEISPSTGRLRRPEDETFFSFGVRTFPQGTRTAQDAATAIGCDVAQICKSLVFRLADEDRPLLVITSGANRVDEARVGALAGGRLERAGAAFVRERTGFAIGGVPPFGHAQPIDTLVDEDLMGFDVVWAAAGTPTSVFPIAPAELVACAGGRVVAVT